MIFKFLIDIFKECLTPFTSPKPKNIPTGDAYSRSVKGLLSDISTENEIDRKILNSANHKNNKSKSTKLGNKDINEIFNKRKQSLLQKNKAKPDRSRNNKYTLEDNKITYNKNKGKINSNDKSKTNDESKIKDNDKENDKNYLKDLKDNQSLMKKQKLKVKLNAKNKLEKKKQKDISRHKNEFEEQRIKAKRKLSKENGKISINFNEKKNDLYETITKLYNTKSNKNEILDETRRTLVSNCETIENKNPFIRNSFTMPMTQEIKFKKFKESDENLSKLIESYSEDNLENNVTDFNKKLAVKMHNYLRKRDMK
ncbi:hypothetical protein DMUE_2178 [Dictyocoela muelleri]|nr:hypothetical protein DMUE_2178 [Dictyocoela muelleri]